MYPLLFRHVLSRFDPEFAHHAAMAVIRVLGVPPFSWATRALTAPSPEQKVHALGLTFPSPFGVAAGFDKNIVGVRGLDALGFGHIEVGTVTAIPQDGNPKPRLFRLVPDRAVVNRMGFNNNGAEAAEARLTRLRRRAPRAVIGVNIGKSRVVAVEDAIADYVASATRLAPLADYLAVNVSSPNTPGLRGLQAVETLAPLLRAESKLAGARDARDWLARVDAVSRKLRDGAMASGDWRRDIDALNASTTLVEFLPQLQFDRALQAMQRSGKDPAKTFVRLTEVDGWILPRSVAQLSALAAKA